MFCVHHPIMICRGKATTISAADCELTPPTIARSSAVNCDRLAPRADLLLTGGRHVDEFLFPSQFTVSMHVQRAFAVPMQQLPYFVPGDHRDYRQLLPPVCLNAPTSCSLDAGR